jgi:RNA polymerase sigma factor (sigma-70 family)
MIVIAHPASAPGSTTAAHEQFVDMLPRIKLQAEVAFRRRPWEEREELVQEVIANAFRAFARLVERDKADVAFATPLAQYAIRQVRGGRRVGARVSARDVLSPANRRLRVARLDCYDSTEAAWREALVEDRQAGPAETAVARLDLAQWFRSLPVRKRRIAKALAAGETTAAAAKQFGLSPARISQLRQELCLSWRAMHGELVAA